LHHIWRGNLEISRLQNHLKLSVDGRGIKYSVMHDDQHRTAVSAALLNALELAEKK
jgi:malic enzyme